MRTSFWQKRLLQTCIFACLFWLLLPMAKQKTEACSWDYLIWMIRSKNADPLYRFVRNDKAGYIENTGKVVIEPKFNVYGNGGGEFHDGLLEIGVSSGQYVDKTGKLVIDKGFERGWTFSEGLAVAMPKNSNLWGYIDRSGQFAISPRFETHPKGYVHSFSEDFAAIEVSKRYGFINRSGNVAIEPKFLHAMDFCDGMARVIIEGPCYFSDDGPCSEVRTIPEWADRDVPACKYAFIDKTGTIISSDRYDRAKNFSEGLAPVRMGERWGFIDKKGMIAITPVFHDAEPFSEGLALIRQNGLYGFIDRAGRVIIAPQFKYAESFAEERAVVSDVGASGPFYYINKLGQQPFPNRYVLASHFYKGLAHVKLKSENLKDSTENSLYAPGKFAYINSSGKEVFTHEGNR